MSIIVENTHTAQKDSPFQKRDTVLAPLRKPSWIKSRPPSSPRYFAIRDMLAGLKLSTVCQEAHCPNMEECWGGGTATFMLMGDTCTRACRFCAVKTGNPKGWLDEEEPEKVGTAIAGMGLDYVVLTSVDRDDLADQGSRHFARTIEVIKKRNPSLLVEILAPDFSGDRSCIANLLKASPDVFAHNVETVERLTPLLRDRRAGFNQSLCVLKFVKETTPDIYTKTSLMLGVGETEKEVMDCLELLRKNDCDIITFGQYLAPSSRHYPVHEYIPPKMFDHYRSMAMDMGFLYAAGGPLVRSSYRAGELFIKNILETKKRFAR